MTPPPPAALTIGARVCTSAVDAPVLLLVSLNRRWWWGGVGGVGGVLRPTRVAVAQVPLNDHRVLALGQGAIHALQGTDVLLVGVGGEGGEIGV
jgi:hypothetical protein